MSRSSDACDHSEETTRPRRVLAVHRICVGSTSERGVRGRPGDPARVRRVSHGERHDATRPDACDVDKGNGRCVVAPDALIGASKRRSVDSSTDVEMIDVALRRRERRPSATSFMWRGERIDLSLNHFNKHH